MSINYQLAASKRDELFCVPPNGRLGVIIWRRLPIPMVGEKIRFVLYGKVFAEGLITAIEQPGSSLRPDTMEFLDQIKVHWVPLDFVPERIIHEDLYR